MKTFSLCASADFHLGMRFSSYPVIQKQLIEARFEALRRVVSGANEHECDLLIIAGDLFDRVNVPPAEVETAASIIAGFEGECTAVLPGNHDYYGGTRSGVWESLTAAGIDSLLFLNEPRPFSLESYHLPVVLYPGPCRSKHSADNAVSWVEAPRNEPEKLHIGVAHGSISGISPDMKAEYYPMDPIQLSLTGLDFWIIGHAHVPYPIAETKNSELIVPGTPEADGFDCSSKGSAAIVSVGTQKETSVQWIDTGTYYFHKTEKEVQSFEDLKIKVDEILAFSGQTCLLQATFRGAMQKNDLPLVRGELERLENSFFYTEIDTRRIKAEITPEEIGNEFREDSFPYRLLTRFAEEGDSEALQLSYRIIREMKE